jgi:Ferritin-like domain
MSSEETGLKLEAVDSDGAIREKADEAMQMLEKTGDTRLDFFKKAGIAGGAAIGGGALLSALAPGAALAGAFEKGGRPPNSFGPGDIGILNYALTLEYLEAAFYNEASANGFATGQTAVALKRVVEDENTHVAALKTTLGNKAVKSPTFDFGTTTTNEGEFLATAYALENTGVHAYLGQGFNIANPAYLKGRPDDRHDRGSSRWRVRPAGAQLGSRDLAAGRVRRSVEGEAGPQRRARDAFHPVGKSRIRGTGTGAYGRPFSFPATISRSVAKLATNTNGRNQMT